MIVENKKARHSGRCYLCFIDNCREYWTTEPTWGFRLPTNALWYKLILTLLVDLWTLSNLLPGFITGLQVLSSVRIDFLTLGSHCYLCIGLELDLWAWNLLSQSDGRPLSQPASQPARPVSHPRSYPMSQLANQSATVRSASQLSSQSTGRRANQYFCQSVSQSATASAWQSGHQLVNR